MTATQEVLWQPHNGPQTTFLASDAYEALYGGAAGGGKSDALLFGGLRQIEHPDYKALLLRRTFPELRELMDRALGVFGAIGGIWNEQQKRWRFPSGATYQFGYCETYADVLQYQGQQFTYIAFDELGQIGEERVWTYLMSRNRASAGGLIRQMRASANPGGPGHHWIKKRFIVACPPDGETVAVQLDDGTVTRAFVQAFLKDNPTLNENDPTYGQRLRLLPDLEYRWLAEGDWNAGVGLGLAELSRKHIVKRFDAEHRIPEHWTSFGALDWGYAHPFSFGLFATDSDGTVYLVDSVSARRLQPPEIAERALAMMKVYGATPKYTVAGHDCWADVRARAENIPTVFEHFVRLGLPLVKANISRVSGVQNIRRYLAGERPRFLICDTPSNRRVFETLETRVSDPDDPEDILKTDADENGEGGDDHYDMCLGGDTLVRTGRGWESIKSLVGTSGICLTPMGWQRYNSVRQTRPLSLLLRVTTDDGTSVEATPDHEILTPNGWRYLDDIGVGSEWVQLAAADRRWSIGAGVSGPTLLAKRGRLLPASNALAAPRGVRSELRADPVEASDSPPRREPGKQSAGELGTHHAEGARAPTLDDRTGGAFTSAYQDDAGQGPFMALFRGGPSVALAEREAVHEASRESGSDMRVLPAIVSEHQAGRAVLPSELQDEVLPPRGPYSIARIVAIEAAGFAPTYNMEVETAHCFAVQGGLVVHNCRYGLASRPIVPKPLAVHREADRSPSIDWKKGGKIVRTTPQDEVDQVLNVGAKVGTVNRHRVPRF